MPRLPLAAAALLLALAAPVRGQSYFALAQDTTAKPAVDTTTPRAIPLSDVPAQAQAVATRIEEVHQELARNRIRTQVEAEFSATQDTIQQLIQLQERPAPEQPTRRSLTDRHNEWVRRKAQVAAWRKTVGDRAVTLGTVQAELSDREASWRLTRTAAVEERAADGIQDLITKGIADLEAANALVAVRLDSLLQLQTQIAQAMGTIEQADEQVSALLTAERLSLLRRESPPVWRAFGAGAEVPGLGETIHKGVVRTGQAVAYFLEVYRGQVYLHLASTLVILFSVAWFRRKLERHTAEQPTVPARRVLDNPLAGAVLIIAVATLFLYPRAPLSIYDLALVVTVPPLLVLLPGILPATLLRPAVILAILFALQRIGGLTLGDSPWARPGLLLLCVLAMAGLVRLLRPGGRLRRLGDDGYARSLRMAARIAMVVFLAATFAEVIGNASLASFLASGMLASAYLLLVVIAAVHVAEGVLIVLTRSDAAGVSRFVAQRREFLLQRGMRLTHFLGALGWVALSLWLFDLLEPLLAALTRALGARLAIGELNLSLGSALLFVGTIWVSILVAQAVSSLLEMDVLSRLDMPRGLPSVLGRLTRYALIAVGFFLALAALGVELTQLTIIGGALGVGIGFGLQNVVSNFVSGLILAFERPIREGDQIQLQNLTGEVRRIGFRATIVRTFDGAEVIVPNAALISNEVTNWTLSDQQRRLTVTVGVAYGTDPARVRDVMLQVPGQIPDVLRTPEPVALFTGFGESALTFELRFWTVDADRVSLIRSAVVAALHDALVAAGIEVPFPQRDLHLRTVDPAAADQLRAAGAAQKEHS